ncbi:MAG: hypothetical protein LBU94_04545 [Clostridiales bacterium]|nr:hypothetical protein [Clostridiales bacterium]
MSKNVKNTAYLILFLAAFISVIMFFTLIYPRINPDIVENERIYVNEELYELPKVDNTVYSSSDGSSHNLSVKFTLAVDEKVHEDLDKEALESHITEIIGTLDYDRISSADGVDYIKKEVASNLGGYVDEEDFIGIYIRGIESDRMPFADYDELKELQENSGRPTRQEILDGLRWED